MDDKRASGRRLTNCFSEIGPQTGSQDLKSTIPPAYLRRMFGIASYASVPDTATTTFSVTCGNEYSDPYSQTGYSVNPNVFNTETFGSITSGASIGGNVINSIFSGSSFGGAFAIGFAGGSPGLTPFTLSFTDDHAVEWQFSCDGTNNPSGCTVSPTHGFTFASIPVSGANWGVQWDFTSGTGSSGPPALTDGNVYTFTATQTSSGVGSQPVRGIRTMAGITYVVIGETLYSLSNNGTYTQPGTSATLTAIASGIVSNGYNFVRMCDNTECLFILVPGTNIGYTYTVDNGLEQYLDETFLFYGGVDVWFIDSYMVFLALNGREFYNDDGQTTSGTGPITFTTGGVFPREFGTDEFVGMCVDHRAVHLFGQLTTEGYVDAGNATESPFAAAPDAFMQIGVNQHCGYTVALQDQSVFWVANDLTVRRLNGQTPVRVSNSGVESLLEDNKLLLYGAYALTPTIGGHPLWVLTMPLAQKTIVYDCLTTEWFDLSSTTTADVEYWRPLCWYQGQGFQLVGDSQASQIGYLDGSIFAEFGQPMAAEVCTQSVYDNHNRITHERVEAVVTVGQGATLPTVSSPQLTVTAGFSAVYGGFIDSTSAGFVTDVGPIGSIAPTTINGYVVSMIAASLIGGTAQMYVALYGAPTNLAFTLIFKDQGGVTQTLVSSAGTVSQPGGSGLTVWTFANSASYNIMTNGNSYIFSTGTAFQAPPGTLGGAIITLFKSDDAGYTWVAREGKQLGAFGSPRTARAVWWRLGQSRDRAYKFRISDPTEFFMVAIVAEVSGGRW
jgi:hypothetical protein